MLQKSNKIFDKFISTLKNVNFDIKLILLSISLILFGFLFQSVYLAITSLLIVFCTIVYVIFKDFKNKYIFMFFLIAFFTFTMSQYFFGNTNSEMYYLNFPNIIIIKTIFMQYLSLIAIYASFYLFDYLKLIFNCKNHKRKSFVLTNDNKIIINILFIITIVIILFSIVSNIDTAMRVFQYGYLEIYVNAHPSMLPSVIHYLGNSVIVFISFYLALSNNKKQIIFILSFYLLNLIISIFAGARSNFVIGILYIFFYLIYFQNKFHFIKKFKLKYIIIPIIIVPTLIVSLSLFNSIRNQCSINEINLTREFNNFFVEQGRSVNLISYAQIYQNQIKEKDTNYVFGPLLYSLNNKIEILSFGKIKINDLYDLNNMRKNNFAVDMTIYLLGVDKYNEGHGVGSQYIAELYIEYGYLGIIVYNLILGLFIYWLNKNMMKNWICFSVVLLLFNSFIFISRGQAMQIVTSLFSINFWGVLFVILIFDHFCRILKKRW